MSGWQHSLEDQQSGCGVQQAQERARTHRDGAWCEEWALEPGFLSVNHGSFGATPRCVLAAQARWRDRLEAQPTRFLHRELAPALEMARAALATFLHADPDGLALVENATAGCNAVFNAFALSPGDEVLVLDHGYKATRNAALHACLRQGARLVEAMLPFPDTTAEGVIASLDASLSARTRLVVLDHVTSASALVLPLMQMVRRCHERGVRVLVDGAHAPGLLPLDVQAIGADWYAGNCHKWLMAPKGCGFLWALERGRQGLHPAVISLGYGAGLHAEFDWTGTRDPSAWLVLPDAIAAHDRLGGPALMRSNDALAADAARLLAAALGTRTGPLGLHAAMAVVSLPGVLDQPAALRLREALLDAGTDAPVQSLGGVGWLRLSAQAYNSLDDYAALAGLLRGVLGLRRLEQ